jgi:Rrf2 family protein
MLDLARNWGKGPVLLRRIATSEHLPPRYLEQILGTLRSAGLVSAVRGPRGGYTLARAPEEISMGEIVYALEGELALVDCVADPDSCDEREGCITRALWVDLSKHIRERLDALTLADLAEGTLGEELTMALGGGPTPPEPDQDS